MAAIYLIRHAQASADQQNYDQLSAHGMAQATILGQHFNAICQADKCYAGTLQRQQQTASQFAAAQAQSLPPLISDDGFNEFDHLDVLAQAAPQLSAPQLSAPQLSAPQLSQLQQLTAKAFQRIFAAALKRWVSGQYDEQYRQSWPQFQQRVNAAFEQVIAAADGARDIVIFTSGGVISVILQQILQLPDPQALEVNAVLANTGISKLLFSGGQRSVAYFNNYTHLELAGPQWLTYR